MGFFSRTCGLSMIEIEEGDEVLVILLNLPYRYLSLGDLLTKVRHQNNRFGDVCNGKIYETGNPVFKGISAKQLIK